MFRTSYVHHQEDYIVHAAALNVLFPMHLFKQFSRLKDVFDTVLSISDYRVSSIEYKVSNTVFDLLGCLYKCMENITCKAAGTV